MMIQRMHLLMLEGVFMASISVAASDVVTIRDYAERDNRSIETNVVKRVGDQAPNQSKHGSGRELVLLVCKPDGWQAGQKRTGMIWVHGGGWVGGHPSAFVPHMHYSAARGAVAFGVQYRLMKSGGYKDNKKLSEEENSKKRAAKHREFMEGSSIFDCIADCEDAVRYIRKNAETLGIDPQKLVSIGDSSGAHLAACLGTLAPEAARVNAMVLCSSISDLTYKFGRDSLKPSPGFEGKELEEDPDRLKRARAASPIFNISKETASSLILHGERDWLRDEPERLYEALKAAGVDVEYKVYPTAKHAFIIYGYSDEQITQTLLDIDAFLVQRDYLAPGTSIRMPAASNDPEHP